MKPRKAIVEEFKSIKQEIEETEKALERLNARKEKVWNMITTPLVSVVEAYLKDILIRGYSNYSDNPGKYLLYEDGWDWDGFIVISEGEYTFVNDYYGDCEVVRFAHHLFLDDNTRQVMVNVHTRYCDTNINDDKENYSFADYACKVCSSGEMLMVEILKKLDRDKEDFNINDGDYQESFALFLVGLQRFSLGALEADDRYDEIGNLVFRKGAIHIKDGEFSNCDKIQTVRIPEGVTDIGNEAFRGCSRLECVELPESLIRIGDGAFKDCGHLQKIVFPKSLKVIGERAFEGCSSLKCINLPDDMESLGRNSFLNVEPSYISHGRIRISPSQIGVDADTLLLDRTDTIEIDQNDLDRILDKVQCQYYFEIPDGIDSFDISLLNPLLCLIRKPLEIRIPRSITEVNMTYGSLSRYLTRIFISPDNGVYDSTENCNAIIDKEEGILMVGCANTVIPKGVSYIDYDAFSGCKYLQAIRIPNGVEEIFDEAFSCCDGLTEVQIPDSVKRIGKDVFCECDSLERLSIPQGLDISCVGVPEKTSIVVRDS